MTQIRPHTIEGLYKTLQAEGYMRNGERREYSYKTLKRIQDILNGIFKYALKLELIDRNPCDVIKTPRVGNTETKIKYFSMEEIPRFLQALEMDYPAKFRAHDRVDDTGKPYHVREYTETFRLPFQLVVFYYVALFTGIRREENITLTWNDVDFENNTLSINKATAKCTGGQYIKRTKTKKLVPHLG
jgi:integrase